MNKNRMGDRMWGCLLAAVFAFSGLAWAGQGRGQATADEFFILNEMNVQKHQLVLKLPSEVTVLMTVNEKTAILDENGKHLGLKDLRAGDTIYVDYVKSAQGNIALKIRLGPMTVEELHRRYLNALPVAVPAPPMPTAPSRQSRSVQLGKASV
ncbi:MAG TPA: hypothetical protein VGS20_09175 [Candidatus Acidoferrales bacterium]|nr:hypothetical protein [Candidatus Acidoferrales bacterium]